MAIKSVIFEKFVEMILPWVKKNIWPLIQQYIISLASDALAWLAQTIKDSFNKRSNERSEQATASAEAAEEKAAQTEHNSSEYHAYKAEAEVWRKVAEQYKKDVEELKQKINELENESIKEFKEDIQEFTPDVTSSNDFSTIKIGGKTHQLPRINLN